MRRRWIILIFGLLLGAGGYAAIYFSGTAERRQMIDQPAPELAWLKKEFNLSDGEFDRIVKLHQEYLPRCAEMCGRIAKKNEELKDLLAGHTNVTSQIEKNLLEAAQLRAECERRMLEHFYAVSRTMPFPQGKRYLEWVQQKTILRPHGKDGMAAMHKGEDMTDMDPK
jgi:hypothetical protein